MDDEFEDDDRPSVWWTVVREVFLVVTGVYTVSDWLGRDGWRLWFAYVLVLALAVTLFFRAQDLWRWARDRRNTPTIHP